MRINISLLPTPPFPPVIIFDPQAPTMSLVGIYTLTLLFSILGICSHITSLIIYLRMCTSDSRWITVLKSTSDIIFCLGLFVSSVSGLRKSPCSYVFTGYQSTGACVAAFFLFQIGFDVTINLNFLHSVKKLFWSDSAKMWRAKIFFMIFVAVSMTLLAAGWAVFVPEMKAFVITVDLILIVGSVVCGALYYLKLRHFLRKSMAVVFNFPKRAAEKILLQIIWESLIPFAYFVSKIVAMPRWGPFNDKTVAYIRLGLAIGFVINIFIIIWSNKTFAKHFWRSVTTCYAFRKTAATGSVDPYIGFLGIEARGDTNCPFEQRPFLVQLRQCGLLDAIDAEQIAQIMTIAQNGASNHNRHREAEEQNDEQRVVGNGINLENGIFIVDQGNLNPVIPIQRQSPVPHRIPLHAIEFTNRLLGSGAFGKVNLAYLKTNDSSVVPVAIKTAVNDSDPIEREWMVRELKLMANVSGGHVNVLSIYGYILDREEKLAAVLEYCELGSLKSYVYRKRNRFRLFEDQESARNESQPSTSQVIYTIPGTLAQLATDNDWITELDLIFYTYQIACGMEFLSLNDIIHRDVALRNMLLTRGKIVKVSDFGLARLHMVSKDSQQEIPIAWMAPEAIARQDYSIQSDVWSFGVVLWELFSLGWDPFFCTFKDALDFQDYLKRGGRMKAPDRCPDKVCKLMGKCWKYNKLRRPSFGACKYKLSETAFSVSDVQWEWMLRQLNVASDGLRSG